MNRQIDAIAAALREAGSIALVCHVNPDGDTIGSALAMCLALRAMGKNVDVYCEDPVPGTLKKLPGAAEVLNGDAVSGRTYDLTMPIDVSADYRMGKGCSALLQQAKHTALIDHHGTNPGFAEVNLVDGSAPAAALPVLCVIRALDVPLSVDMGICLYAALSTDTGNFAYGSTTPEAFRVGAELLELGIPLADWNRRLFREHPFCQTKLLGCALETLRAHAGGAVTSMRLTREDFENCGASEEHADTIVNYAMNVQGAKMAVLARENGKGGVKLSLRAAGRFVIDGVAASFGGGGHPQASGATLNGMTLTEAEEAAIQALVAAYTEQEKA